MEIFGILSLLTSLAAVFGYLNSRYIKLPYTIGMMLIACVFSLIVFLIGAVNQDFKTTTVNFITQIDFKTALLEVMLSFLLFAGALHINFEKLREYKWPIFTFATIGVLVSTILVGVFIFIFFKIIAYPIDLIYCMLFGALISPTDPIAVLGIMKKAGVPKNLEIKIVGESLFNDGVGVVIFLTIFNLAYSSGVEEQANSIVVLFLQEVVGGLALGLLAGWITWKVMKTIDDWEVEVMITIAVVMSVYWIATYFHLSGPLAVVAAGLLIGTENVRHTSMSGETENYIDKFWELVDSYLNAILFVLIGLEILIWPFKSNYVIYGFIAIPVVLAARFLSLYPPVYFFGRTLEFVPKTTTLMTWGGLRGGISIALALSLEQYMERDLFLVMTYIVVVFSILVQGLTINKLVKRVLKLEPSKE